MLKKILFLSYILIFGNFVLAQHEVATVPQKPLTEEQRQDVEREKEKEENAEFIQHHLLDAHDFSIMSNEKTGQDIGFPLPVIIYDNGFHFFMSSEFDHGKKIANVDGNYYVLHHEKIYKTNESGDLKLNKEGHPEVPKVLDLSITKSVLMILVTALIMVLLFVGMAKRYGKSAIPTGVSKFLEPLVIFIRDDIARPNIGYKYKKFMSYLLTIFFFILFLNVFGLMPFGINVTGNITITFFLALMTYLITTFSANKDYWLHIFWMPGVPVPMKLVMLPIELLGTLTKPFALMIRLFANMSAGHIVIMSLIALIYYFKNVVAGVAFPMLTFVLYLLEVLVAFLQAYIFTMLSALFIGMAVQEHEHDENHAPEHH